MAPLPPALIEAPPATCNKCHAELGVAVATPCHHLFCKGREERGRGEGITPFPFPSRARAHFFSSPLLLSGETCASVLADRDGQCHVCNYPLTRVSCKRVDVGNPQPPAEVGLALAGLSPPAVVAAASAALAFHSEQLRVAASASAASFKAECVDQCRSIHAAAVSKLERMQASLVRARQRVADAGAARDAAAAEVAELRSKYGAKATQARRAVDGCRAAMAVGEGLRARLKEAGANPGPPLAQLVWEAVEGVGVGGGGGGVPGDATGAPPTRPIHLDRPAYRASGRVGGGGGGGGHAARGSPGLSTLLMGGENENGGGGVCGLSPPHSPPRAAAAGVPSAQPYHPPPHHYQHRPPHGWGGGGGGAAAVAGWAAAAAAARARGRPGSAGTEVSALPPPPSMSGMSGRGDGGGGRGRYPQHPQHHHPRGGGHRGSSRGA